MTTIDDYLRRARIIFEKLTVAPDESLSKTELLEAVSDADYELVRRALLATEKVDATSGRAGGLTIRRTQGNRREWGHAAETKARRFLEEYEWDAHDGTAEYLQEINQTWPQSRIAEVLGVSQPRISNWIRTGTVPAKYVEAVRQLRFELKDPSSDDARKANLPAPDLPPAPQYGDWLRGELERRQTNAVELAAQTGIHINTIVALMEGRTERPQQRTRQLIEKALQDSAPTESTPAPNRPVEEDPWYYIGLPWRNEEIDQVPDEPGVYIIHDRLGRPAYVGVAYKGAGGIRARLKKHDQLRWTADRKVAAAFSYALAARMPRNDASMLAKALEKLLIKFMGNAILINEKDVEDLAD